MQGRFVTRRSAMNDVQVVEAHARHVFPNHFHDTFGIGSIVAGAQRSWGGREKSKPPSSWRGQDSTNRKRRCWVSVRRLLKRPAATDCITAHSEPAIPFALSLSKGLPTTLSESKGLSLSKSFSLKSASTSSARTEHTICCCTPRGQNNSGAASPASAWIAIGLISAAAMRPPPVRNSTHSRRLARCFASSRI